MAYEPEFFSNVRRHFELMFPAGNQRPYWGQQPYRSDYFKVFMEIQRQERFPADKLRHFIEEWLPNLNDDDQHRLTNMLSAWDEWLYAKEQLTGRAS